MFLAGFVFGLAVLTDMPMSLEGLPLRSTTFPESVSARSASYTAQKRNNSPKERGSSGVLSQQSCSLSLGLAPLLPPQDYAKNCDGKNY